MAIPQSYDIKEDWVFYVACTSGGFVNPVRLLLIGCLTLLLSISWLACDSGNGGGGLGRTVGGGTSTASFLLVTDATGNKVLTNSIATNGTLTPDGTANTDAGPTAIAVASGKIVLVANSNSSTVSSFTLSTAGALSANGVGSFSAGLNPNALAVAPGGGSVVIANRGSNNLNLDSIDTNGILTQVNTLGLTSTPRAMIFAGSILYVATTTQLSGYQVSGGIISPLPLATVAGTNFSALASSGTFLYVSDDAANVVNRYSIDSNTGALNLTGIASPVGSIPTAMTFDNTGTFLFVVNNASNDISVFSRDINTGALTSAGTVATGGTLPTSVAFDATNSLLFVANSGSGTVSVFTVTGGIPSAVGSPVPMGTQPFGVAVANPQ